MAQTVASLTDVLKETWTSDVIEKQFYDEHPILDRFSKFKATMVGKQAQVPIHKGRSGGYTSATSAGGNLNAAGNQAVDQAAYTLVYHWFQTALETGAINQASGSNLQSVIAAKDFEMQGSINDQAHQCVRQLVTNGDGIVAACATGGASTTVSLVASPSGTAYGYDALVRGWLYPGLPVDIGTTADTDSLATGSLITAVSESASAPTITIGSSISTTASTHFVYIANPNSATASSPELNGLRNIVNTSGALGGLNPANAGEEFWAAPARDTTTTVLSLDLALSLSRAVRQKTGKPETDCWTGLKQLSNFYSLLQNQVRFAGEMNMSAGNVGGVKWNGMNVEGYNDILDSDWYALTLADFVRATGEITKPTWATDLQGSGGSLVWGAGTTAFSNAVVYPFQIGVRRRNGCAAATGLTV